ncbi:MAG: MATE family efflux transporter [Clostridiaceae bacterium]|jgi:putative MATE family efflux protein|nr:MATE family efflux transporter [Clostridiaceae bacterium]
MAEAKVFPLLVRMSGPAMFSMLIMSLYNIVDSLFVSSISEIALRSVSIIFPVQQLMVAFAVGTSVGVNSYVARRLGAEDPEAAGSAASHGLVLSFVNSLFFLVTGFLLAPAVVNLFSNHGEVISGSVDYLRIVTMASIGLFWQIHCEKIFQATGNMTRAMYIQLLGALLNIALDPILIFGWFGLPAMGVRGAAVATVIAQIIAGAIAVYLVLRKETVIKVTLKSFRFQKHILAGIYRVGLPSLVMQSVTAMVGMVFNMIILPFSEIAITVLGVYLKLESFVFMPVFGIGQGMLPLMAYNFGAKRYDRVRQTLKSGLILMAGIMSFSMVLFQLIPRLLLAAFNATEEMYTMGIPAFRNISLCFIFAGIAIILSISFQALGKGTYSLFISIFRQLVLLLPLARLFAVWHLDYVWYSYAISDLGAALMAIFLFRRLSSRIMPATREEEEPGLSREAA